MSRALIVLSSPSDRRKAALWLERAPKGSRVEFKAPRRSVPQNDLMWGMLTDVAQQIEWYGQRLTAQDWKDLLTACLRKSRVVPGIDPGTTVPLGLHTSDMSKEEMSTLLELIIAFGTERGVKFTHLPPVEEAA